MLSRTTSAEIVAQPVAHDCICAWCGAVLGAMPYASPYSSFGICRVCVRVHFAYLFESDAEGAAEKAALAAHPNAEPRAYC